MVVEVGSSEKVNLSGTPVETDRTLSRMVRCRGLRSALFDPFAGSMVADIEAYGYGICSVIFLGNFLNYAR